VTGSPAFITDHPTIENIRGTSGGIEHHHGSVQMARDHVTLTMLVARL